MLNADRSNLFFFFFLILAAASFLSAQQKTEGPLLESCSLYFRLHSARSESQRASNSGDDARLGEGSKEKSRHMRPHVSFRQYSSVFNCFYQMNNNMTISQSVHFQFTGATNIIFLFLLTRNQTLSRI